MASSERVAREASVVDLPLRASRRQGRLTGAPAMRQRAIVDAAVDCFYEAGYAAASVEDVAKAVGILKGSLYHYIDSKEDLLFRIIELVHEDVDAIFAEVVSIRGLSPLEQLEECVRRLALYKLANGRRYVITHREKHLLNPERSARISGWTDRRDRFFAQLIRQAVAAGELPRELDVELALYFSRTVTSSTFQRSQPANASPEVLAAAIADFLVEGFVEAVRPRPLRPRRSSAWRG